MPTARAAPDHYRAGAINRIFNGHFITSHRMGAKAGFKGSTSHMGETGAGGVP
jgi:hypothetical protein